MKLKLAAMDDNTNTNSQVDIVYTEPRYLRELVENLRSDDAQEILAFGVTPQKAVWRSYKGSVISRTALVNGKVAAVWGVGGTFMGAVGQPWLLTSDEVHKVSPLKFARIYQQEVLQMLELFPALMNFVSADYASAIRLLDIVGFKLSEPQKIGSAWVRKFEMKA